MGELNKIKDDAVEISKRYSCVDILKDFGYPIKIRGKQAYSICFNCGGNNGVKMDKFSVNTSKNMYYCFGCGKGGGPAKLYSELTGISFIESSLLLAYKMGGITEEQFQKVSNCRDEVYDKLKSDSKIYSVCDEMESMDAEHKAPKSIVNMVYGTMLGMEEFKLDDDSYRYLVNVRKLSDREIKKIGFFSYKKTFSIDKLCNMIKEKMPEFTYDMFLGVPGFYFEYANKEKTMGRWRFKAPYQDCLGIPLRDYDGNIIALQLRYMGKKKTQNKYFYVSSTGISEKGKQLAFGSSPGSPVSVLYPAKLRSPIFYIGEGVFKMNEISKEGYVSFSCQGVNTFHYAVDEVKACMNSEKMLSLARHSNMRGQHEVQFVIVFDADMYYKIQVLEAGITACSCLKKAFSNRKVYFLLWDGKYGKGYDDMKFYCQDNNLDYRKKVKVMDSDMFISLAKKSITESDKRYLAMEKNAKNRDNKESVFRVSEEWKSIMKEVFFDEKILPYLGE